MLVFCPKKLATHHKTKRSYFNHRELGSALQGNTATKNNANLLFSGSHGTVSEHCGI